MTETNREERHSSEDEAKKSETLFSKKFQEYLSSKKLSASNDNRIHKPPILVKEYSASSGETTASESSRRSGRKVRKKVKERQSHWDFNHGFRNRLTQCSLLKSDEAVSPPEDLKPLLLNMTILLQDLKQSPSEFENLYNLITRITILVTEFVRRPLKKVQETYGEQARKVEKTVEAMITLLQEYKNGPNLDSDNRIREYKRLEKEIAHKNHQIAEAEKTLAENTEKIDLRVKDSNLRVRNSIWANERLKSEIKFNQSHVKKYKKLLVEKEWVKHKLETDLSHLKKKLSRADLCDSESLDKQQLESPEPSLKSENLHVGFLLPKNKTTKPKKPKEIHKSAIKLK